MRAPKIVIWPESKEGPRATYVKDGDDEEDGGHVGEERKMGGYIAEGKGEKGYVGEGFGSLGEMIKESCERMRRGEDLLSEDGERKDASTNSKKCCCR